ncbi:MAG: 6-phosphogluconolactonase [Alphaproteobacteria bacterium]
MIEEREFATLEEAATALAADMAERLRTAVAERGRASLAVSGGRTPHLVLPGLSRVDLPWDRVRVTLTDDRWVPPDHPDSNERLARALLLTGPAAAATFTGLVNGAASPSLGQPETERRLATFPLPLDVVFLGMGEDGHIASLFPHGPELTAGGLCVASRAPVAPHPRLSLSASLLLTARATVLLVAGAAKRAIYETAKGGSGSLEDGDAAELPVRLVLHQRAMPVTVFLA